MNEHDFIYYCYVCGHKNLIHPEVLQAPEMKKQDVICEKCFDSTHILVTSCPICKEGIKYFLSDLDFPEEVNQLASAYLNIVQGIKDSLSDYIEEFDVALPKRWTVKLKCSCGEEYSAELPLPHALK